MLVVASYSLFPSTPFMCIMPANLNVARPAMLLRLSLAWRRPCDCAVARVAKEEDDEYAVTEDEEGQEDEGIEDDEEGFSPIGHGKAHARNFCLACCRVERVSKQDCTC